MAVCWIEKIQNNCPSPLRLQLKGTRTVRLHGVQVVDGIVKSAPGVIAELPPEFTITFPSGVGVERAEQLELPWGNVTDAAGKGLALTFGAAGATVGVRCTVSGEGIWDCLQIAELKDDRYRKRAHREVGSLGDAPKTNHSAWILTHTAAGWVTLERRSYEGENKYSMTNHDFGDGVIKKVLNSETTVTLQKES